MGKLSVLSCLILIFLAGTGFADIFYVIPALPDSTIGTNLTNVWVKDVSGWNNGNPTVIGLDRSWGGGSPLPMVYTPSGGSKQLLGLSGSTAICDVRGVSGDGSVIVGFDKGLGWHAVRFYADGVTNATKLASAYSDTEAYGITNDGTKAFGFGSDGLNTTTTQGAIFNVSAGTMVSQPVGSFWINAASDNGLYLAGNFRGQTMDFASRSGTVYNLTGSATTVANGISADGSVVVGVYDATNDTGRYWTWDGTKYVSKAIPAVVGATCTKWGAPSVSDDGNIIVGSVRATTGDTTWKPYIWIRDQWTAPKLLTDFLCPDALAKIPSGWIMEVTPIISGDGTAITGWLKDTGSADYLGYVAMVPEPATIALLGLGGLALIRRRKR